MLKKFEIIEEEKDLYCRLPGHCKVLSTSPLNGGIRENLALVFNHDCLLKPWKCRKAEKSIDFPRRNLSAGHHQVPRLALQHCGLSWN